MEDRHAQTGQERTEQHTSDKKGRKRTRTSKDGKVQKGRERIGKYRRDTQG